MLRNKINETWIFDSTGLVESTVQYSTEKGLVQTGWPGNKPRQLSWRKDLTLTLQRWRSFRLVRKRLWPAEPLTAAVTGSENVSTIPFWSVLSGGKAKTNKQLNIHYLVPGRGDDDFVESHQLFNHSHASFCRGDVCTRHSVLQRRLLVLHRQHS